MNDRLSSYFLTLIILTAVTAGCRSKDPSPYWFEPTPLPSIEEQKKYREARDKRLQEYVDTHPITDPKQKALVQIGLVDRGLTKEQVRVIINKPPDKIETGALKYGADEMWFYRGHLWNDYYYFKDDILIEIDQKR